MGIVLCLFLALLITFIVAVNREWVATSVVTSILLILVLLLVIQSICGFVPAEDVAQEYAHVVVLNQYFLYNAEENIVNEQALRDIVNFNSNIKTARQQNNFWLRNLTVDSDYANYEPIKINLEGY